MVELVDLWSPEFWTAVAAAATVATVFGGGASLILTVVWRYLDQKEADFVCSDGSSTWRVDGPPGNKKSEGPYGSADLVNAGDGTAFRVTVTGSWCTPRLEGEPIEAKWGIYRPGLNLLPTVSPGGTVHLRVDCDPRLWNVAEIHLRWRRRRRSTRYLTLPLRDLAPQPPYQEYETVNGRSHHVDTDPSLSSLSGGQSAALRRGPVRWWQAKRQRRHDQRAQSPWSSTGQR